MALGTADLPRRLRRLVGSAALGVLVVLSAQWAGQSVAQGAPVLSPDIAGSLERAAETGPRALLTRLNEILRAHPDLAADPVSAGALARAAAMPVGQFVGANVPVYRDIVGRIIDAAPENVRPAVSRAVAEQVRQVALTDPMVREPLVRDMASLVEQARAAAERAGVERGIRAGSFVIYPELQVSEYYDDNIFATKSNRTDDFITVFAPHVYAVSDWDRHRLLLQAHLDATRYQSHEKENSNDYWLAGEGRIDLGDRSNVFGGVLYGRFHEDRDSPDDINGLEPTLYSEKRAYAGGAHSIGRIRLRAGVTASRVSFRDTETSTTTFNNADRNRDTISIAGAAGYALNDIFEPYAEFISEMRNYRSAVDDNGFDRDSDGYRARGGLRFRVRGKADGQLYAGYMRQDYDDAMLDTIGGVDYGGNVRWRFISSTLLTVWVGRSIEETTLFASSGYIFTEAGAIIEHDINADWHVTMRGYTGRSNFEGTGRSDEDYDTGAGIRYDVTANISVAADYRYQKRISTIDPANYRRHQVFLRATAAF